MIEKFSVTGTNHFVIRGVETALRRLRELPRKVEKKVLRQALRAGAKVVLPEVIARSPRVSGRMVEAFKVRAAKQKKKGQVGIVIINGEGFYKGSTFYAAFVIFGHHLGRRPRGRPRSAAGKAIQKMFDKRRWIPGNPFLLQAFNAKQAEAAEVIVSQVQAGIEREASSG